MVANASYGTNTSAPELITSPTHEGKWALWETLARKRKDIFRDPSVFTGHIDEVIVHVIQCDPKGPAVL